MAKTKPVTQPLADKLSEIEAQTQAIVEYEFHERQALEQINKREQQIQKLAKELDKWNKALADTRSLLRAQREKLERDYDGLRTESFNLEGKYCKKCMPVTYGSNGNPFE